MRGEANGQGQGQGRRGEPQQTLLRQSARSQPQGQAGRRGPAALLATLLYLMFSCSHPMVRNNVLGNSTYDSSGILSYILTQFPSSPTIYELFPLEKHVEQPICYHSFLLRARLELGLN